MKSRKSWSDLRRKRLQSRAARVGYENARLAYELGRQVRQLREAHGLSQRQLAERTRTTQSVIARLEAGGSKPSISTLERVAAALGTSVDIRFGERVAANWTFWPSGAVFGGLGVPPRGRISIQNRHMPA